MLWAVHISDSVLSWPWQLGGFLGALVLLCLALVRVREEEIPRIGLLTAAFFVASSIHIRLGPTSVHLLLVGLLGAILGRRALPGRSLYSASKFAIEGWTQALRAEFARFDIAVILINPGLTQTNFSQNMLERNAKMQLDHMRGMTSEQVAEATLQALATGKKVVNLTFKGKLLLFAARYCPKLIDVIARKKVRKLFADEIAAKAKAASLIDQANKSANQMIEDARVQAQVEGERIRQQAREAIDQEINKAREGLRAQVAELAVLGAEKILQEKVNPETHANMLNQLAAKL